MTIIDDYHRICDAYADPLRHMGLTMVIGAGGYADPPLRDDVGGVRRGEYAVTR